jgi:hypothetical protein
MATAAKAAAHVAAPASKPSAVTTAASTATGVGGGREQARCEQGRCKYRDRFFHHDTPST